MTHFTVGIIVPPQCTDDRRNLERFIKARKAPFNENRLVATFSHEGEQCRIYNPDGRWDYCQVGGPWNGWLTDMPPCHDQLVPGQASTAGQASSLSIRYSLTTWTTGEVPQTSFWISGERRNK